MNMVTKPDDDFLFQLGIYNHVDGVGGIQPSL